MSAGNLLCEYGGEVYLWTMNWKCMRLSGALDIYRISGIFYLPKKIIFLLYKQDLFWILTLEMFIHKENNYIEWIHIFCNLSLSLIEPDKFTLKLYYN